MDTKKLFPDDDLMQSATRIPGGTAMARNYHSCCVCDTYANRESYKLSDGRNVCHHCWTEWREAQPDAVLARQKNAERREAREREAQEQAARETALRETQDVLAPDGYQRMVARYNGTCEVCGEPIVEGEDIYWMKGNGARHANCAGGERRVRQSRSCYETEQDRRDVEGEPLTGGNEVYGGPAD